MGVLCAQVPTDRAVRVSPDGLRTSSRRFATGAVSGVTAVPPDARPAEPPIEQPSGTQVWLCHVGGVVDHVGFRRIQ